ncbi:autotransporter outer membrane beta-barrel domain-containing protein [Bordetella genomosp. 8]|uniref:autotransporter outer membrane beta-barrel domain-containing protein n=1 Tax=Bordetella genomosp. 8 TaxID=1416806 RepID=UPI0012FD30F9|nr:autotransporter outer membrane beta-barrel domain-containing protein [Bordetella genomosp. 8]
MNETAGFPKQHTTTNDSPERRATHASVAAGPLAPPAPPWPRFTVLSAAVACGLIGVLPRVAQASCSASTVNGATTETCSISSGSYSTGQALFYGGASGTSSNKNGSAGPQVSITNDGNFSLNYSVSNIIGGAAILGGSEGGSGYDEGAGGAAGAVTLTNNGTLSAFLNGTGNGFYPTGKLLYALSAGGSGSQDNKNNNSNGGLGGNSGTVTVTNNAALSMTGTVSGEGFFGILADARGGIGGEQNNSAFGDQLGGGGGSASVATVNNYGGIALGNSGSRVQGTALGAAILSQSVGGSGGPNNGNAGAGGYAVINNTAPISVYWNATTEGYLFGLSSRSVGGDGLPSTDNSDRGGSGGSAEYASVTSSNANVLLDVTGSPNAVGAAIAALSHGGAGGKGPGSDEYGGSGGVSWGSQVKLLNGGSVTTRGDSMFGILAESLGGLGGDGSNGGALAGTGGGGGFGGNGGLVYVNTDASTTISTSGNYSAAIVGHSVGGGGGTGSDFVGVLGGSGGNGGNGGDASNVTIQTAGRITTSGDHAYGILAQSVGGSGGNGGVDTSSLVSLGGSGAGGGTAGMAQVANTGPITTAGYAAHGIVAQSIGGGGGAAGSSNGLLAVGGNAAGSTTSPGGMVQVYNSGAVTTGGNAAIGLLAQSVGGGGGTGGSAKGIAGVGGTGSAGGAGGAVNMFNLGTIQTTGSYAIGALAQSVGGGGGNGGDTMTVSTGVSLGIGGSASGGGNGGTVCVDNTGSCGPLPAILPGVITTQGDYAVGLIAQSVGGGGGNGGSASNVSLASFVQLQIGGSAGAGGSGGNVSVQQDFLSIATSGQHATGVLAQSIGGGGGNGGDSSYFNATIGFNAGVAIGGSGGAGGSAGTTTVNLNNGSIVTGMPPPNVNPSTFAPDDAFGILAQSIGGGGGNGGSATAKDFVLVAPTGTGVPVAVNMQASVGGNGGVGGAGNTVTVNLANGTSVATLGDGSHAVVAQSIGGGGGNGGDASTLSTTLGDSDSVEISSSIAIGGINTGNGSNGGQVNLTLGDAGSAYARIPAALQLPPVDMRPPPSTIVTYGDYANGVLAQSIGGGGGNGGVGASNAYAQGGLVNLKATVGLGGQGGQGGYGGTVNVTQNPNQTIQTLGSGSRGITAQSIGGGGGNSQGGTLYLGGAVNGYGGRLSVGVGKTGGSGGDGGAVTATTSGAIATAGGDADGVMLQSIGGGGGLGGSIGADASSNPILDRIAAFEDNKNRLTDSGATYTLTVNVGGSGGGGGDGGAVTFTHAGQIATQGDWADGYVAQSIGGGGGAGGSSTASGSKVNANITVGVGGTGGVSGNGGNVKAVFDDDHANLITTAGYSAYGVLLQSIGGGGGQGGDGSDMASGNITVGGVAGGAGGASGSGGTITIPTGGSWINISTTGSDSPALVMQSIGGGGGIGGAGNTSSALGLNTHEIALAVGGKGGVTGDGGSIDASTGGAFTTTGPRAYGVLAQSIGGGGGIGGAGNSGNLLGAGLGGSGGAGGNGGSVNLALTSGSRLNTSGAGAHAIVAQSIGGGGGIAGDSSLSLQLDPDQWSGKPADANASGNGGPVTVSVDGGVNAYGTNAFGILAQSIGGGGGLGGAGASGFAGNTNPSAQGTAGAVQVTQAGTLNATGSGGTGIFAQSQGPSGNGIITVNVNGSVQGGTGDNASGVWIAAGTDNVLNVGAGGSISALSGVAVRYNGNNETSLGSVLTINNNGTIQGNVICNNLSGNAACTGNLPDLNNASTGTLANASIYQADVDNAGLMVVGTPGRYDTTSVSGSFRQQASGVLRVTTDFDQMRTNSLVVQGPSTLDGKVDVTPTNLLPDREVTVLTTQGATQGQLDATDSPIIDYATRQAGPDVRVRAAGADFAAPSMGLRHNQETVANNLQRAWDAGGNPGFGVLFAALDQASRQGADSYRQSLSDLSPGVALAPAVQMQASMARFNNGMMSCPVFTSSGPLTGERDCLWGQVTGRSTHQDGNGGTADLKYDSMTYQFGGQRQFRPDWFIGASGAYQSSQLRGQDGRVTGDGDSGYLGVVLKHQAGPWTFSGALGGGYGSYELDRNIGIPGLQSTADGNPDVYSMGAKLRAARTFAPTDSFYLKPYLDLDATYVRMPGYKESGNELHLSVDGSDQFVMALSPMLEIGGRAELGNGATMRPYAYAGASFLSKDKWRTNASFQGAPAGSGSFSTTMETDSVIARIGAGLQVTTRSGVDFRLQYNGELSGRIASHSGTLRVMAPF